MASLVSWKDNEAARVERHVSEALDRLSPDGSLTGANIWRFDVYARVLALKITIDGVHNPHERAQLIGSTLMRLKKAKVEPGQGQQAFRDLLDELARERRAAAPRLFRLILPLNVRSQYVESVRSIEIEGLSIRRTTWRAVGRISELEDWSVWAHELAGYENSIALLQSEFTPLTIRIADRTPHGAWARGFRAFELLRVALNLHYTWGRVQTQFGSPRPLARVLPSPVCAVLGEGEAPTWHGAPTRYHYSSRASGVAFEAARGFLKGLRGIRSDEIRRLVATALLKYGEALDTTEWRRQAFLSLWQGLELLPVPAKDERSIGNVNSRIALLLGQKPVDVDLLKALSETRHKLVHAGLFPDEDGLEELQLLKWIFERSVTALFTWPGPDRPRTP